MIERQDDTVSFTTAELHALASLVGADEGVYAEVLHLSKPSPELIAAGVGSMLVRGLVQARPDGIYPSDPAAVVAAALGGAGTWVTIVHSTEDTADVTLLYHGSEAALLGTPRPFDIVELGAIAPEMTPSRFLEVVACERLVQAPGAVEVHVHSAGAHRVVAVARSSEDWRVQTDPKDIDGVVVSEQEALGVLRGLAPIAA